MLTPAQQEEITKAARPMLQKAANRGIWGGLAAGILLATGIVWAAFIVAGR